MEETPTTKLLVFIKSHLLLAGGALLGLVFLSIGIYLLLPKAQDDAIIFEESVVSPTTTSISEAQKGVVVDVSGAVKHPGIYTLGKDARVNNAIEAAGGLRDDANQESISKNINLAQILTDGMKLYLPFTGEDAVAPGGSVAGVGEKMIHLNTASLSELDSLPKVGEVTAQKIIDNRPYTDVKDLLTKKVVGTSVFSEIESMISP